MTRQTNQQGDFNFSPKEPKTVFVATDIYPWCINHPGRDAHWRLGEPEKHRGEAHTFLCDECHETAMTELIPTAESTGYPSACVHAIQAIQKLKEEVQ